jgi:hypothetical protein
MGIPVITRALRSQSRIGKRTFAVVVAAVAALAAYAAFARLGAGEAEGVGA